MNATVNQSTGTRPYPYERHPAGMAKKRKLKWQRKPCGCVKATLSIGRAMVRCEKHRGKPAKDRVLLFWDEGYVRREAA